MYSSSKLSRQDFAPYCGDEFGDEVKMNYRIPIRSVVFQNNSLEGQSMIGDWKLTPSWLAVR